jgi:hypothetical protein
MSIRAGWMIAVVGVVGGLLASAAQAGEPNVILITFDGVRPQDFFEKSNLPGFWSKLAPKGVVLGKGSPMTIDNPAHISLPGYQNLMAGAAQPCITNDCGRITVETLGEHVVHELKLPREKVASISSWEKIPLAFEKTAGTTFTNGGFEPLNDGGKDAELAKINQEMIADKPHWKENRFDKYTIAHAMRYLKLHQPRFLYISINDTDDWAHENDHDGVVKALQAYDVWLGQLFAQLDSMGEYGRDTTVLITTDHSRGKGKRWIDHEASLPEARNIWLYARGPGVKPTGIKKSGAKHTHSDVRPTIEALFGIKPVDCKGCGKPIEEIAGPIKAP